MTRSDIYVVLVAAIVTAHIICRLIDAAVRTMEHKKFNEKI